MPAGNALVEGATFIAILLGTIAGGLAAQGGSDPIFFAFLIIAFSLSCWVSSLFIPPTGQAAPNLVVRTNIVVSTLDLLRQLREDPRIWWGAIVTCWFWAVGGLALVLLPPLVKNALGGSEEVATFCLAIFAIAIAVGSGLAAWLAAGRIILLPTVLGAVLLGLFAFDFGFATWGLVPAAQGLGHRRRVRLVPWRPHRYRSRRPGHRRRPVHRAGVLRGAGLGRCRPPRPGDCRRQRAQCRRHGAQHHA